MIGARAIAAFGLAVLAIAGCGGPSLRVGPGNASADHLAPAPGNAVDFASFQSCNGPGSGCAEEVGGTWTTSDLARTRLDEGCSSGGNACRVICLATVSGVTITVSNPHQTASATLDCK